VPVGSVAGLDRAPPMWKCGSDVPEENESEHYPVIWASAPALSVAKM